jgi:ABC-type Fe3+-siderophore transport system permease subunit
MLENRYMWRPPVSRVRLSNEPFGIILLLFLVGYGIYFSNFCSFFNEGINFFIIRNADDNIDRLLFCKKGQLGNVTALFGQFNVKYSFIPGTLCLFNNIQLNQFIYDQHMAISAFWAQRANRLRI